MTTYFFSSTGNSLSVAKKIGGKLISIPQAMKEDHIHCQDDAIGLVFPVYGLSVPPLVRQFLSRVELKTSYLFCVVTYGTYAGATVRQLTECAHQNGLTFDYVTTLHMQENYLPGFAMEQQQKPALQDQKLDTILSEIQKQTHFVKHDSAFSKMMTKLHQKNYKYEIGKGFVDSFIVSDSCIGCGLCEKICPMSNIQIQNGKPTFYDHCCSCFACIQNCQKGALSIQGEKGHDRYRNPEITLEELLKANTQQLSSESGID